MRRWITVLMVSLAMGCATARYDSNSYNAAMGLKSDATLLMQQAGTVPVPSNSIAAVVSRLEAQVAYEDGKGKPNWASARQWKIMADKSGALLGAFLQRWLSGAAMNAAYIEEKRKQVSDGFDEILRMEGAKPK